MRATTLLDRLLALPGTSVSEVSFGQDVVTVTVSLRRRRLYCPQCEYSTSACYDTRAAHGVRVEGVPFARHRSGFTRDFEDLVAYLATKTDKTTITRMLRSDWDTVGRACERVVADSLDPGRLDGLVNIGVDELSWRTHHRYLTLVTDPVAAKIVWGAEGKDTATLDAFFDELGQPRSAALQAISMDMGAVFNKSARADGHAPQAVICIDRSTPSSSSLRPWTSFAARPGTGTVNCPTRGPRRGSRAPAGRCPRTSPRLSPRRCANSATAAVTSGVPTP